MKYGVNASLIEYIPQKEVTGGLGAYVPLIVMSK